MVVGTPHWLTRVMARRVRLALRVLVIVGLSVVAWWAWHPSAWARPLTDPELVTESRHALGPGVALRRARVKQEPWRVIDFEVDLALAHLEVAAVPGGRFLAELAPEGAIAAVNGAFFEADFSPHGWLVDRGAELQPKRESSPHHVFAIRGTQAFGGRWEALPFSPELAVQNFPLLVENGEARVKASDRDSGFARTFICDSGGGVVHLVVVLPEDLGPSLVETAHLAAAPVARGGFGCLSAVNLDGGPSSGFWIDEAAGVPFVEPTVRIGHALALVANAPKPL